MTHHEELIAMLLNDAPRSPRLAHWLTTPEGRRELAAYRRMLRALRTTHGRTASAAPPTAYYDTLSTPIGRVLVANTDAGILRIGFRQSESAFVKDLRRRFGVAAVRSPRRVEGSVRQLRAYFAGQRRTFDLRVDLSRLTAFQRRVLQATARVPAGRVVSYGDIARRVGRPQGSRAVGQALGHNPIPIVIPCHRVVAAGGNLGGYTGGLHIKRTLLRLEHALA